MSTLDVLIQKLAGANSTSSAAETVIEETVVSDSITDPVFVEKLASAVDFIVDNYADQKEESQANQEKVATEAAAEAVEEQVTNVSDISDVLRARLQARLEQKNVEKEEADNERKSQVAKNILGKLLELKASNGSEQVATDEETSEDEEASLDEAFETEPYNQESGEVSNETPQEEEVKAASAVENQSLADVLNAALSSDEQDQESVREEDAKTAGVRGGNESSTRKQGVEVLKEKLLATVGKEAQS